MSKGLVGGRGRRMSTGVPEYSAIINKVKELDVDDDDIEFKQKMERIIENWQKVCSTGEEVGKSFESLYRASLADEHLASKLVVLISSKTFINQEIHGTNIRYLFLRQLQFHFEGSRVLQKMNPVALRNSLRIMGEFFHKARLSDGSRFMFLIDPIVTYLAMLLESAETEDIKLAISHLLLNGHSIKSECMEKLVQLLNIARMTMLSNSKLTAEGKMWLLMCIDLGSSKFGLPLGQTHNFYLERLNNRNIPDVRAESTPSVVQSSETCTQGLSHTDHNASNPTNSKNTRINSGSPPSQDLSIKGRKPPSIPRLPMGVGIRLTKYKSMKDNRVRENNS